MIFFITNGDKFALLYSHIHMILYFTFGSVPDVIVAFYVGFIFSEKFEDSSMAICHNASYIVFF